MSRKFAFFLVVLLVLMDLEAFDTSRPESFLGLGIEDLFSSDAVPLHIYPQRGVEADEDNVVFFYGEGFSLFLFKNRVWQVRYDRRAPILPDSLFIGQERSKILSFFLEQELAPLTSGDDSLTYSLRERPWPIRMKLFFSEDKLDDLYVYRADF